MDNIEQVRQYVSLLERVLHFGVDLNTAILALRVIAGEAECIRRGYVGQWHHDLATALQDTLGREHAVRLPSNAA